MNFMFVLQTTKKETNDRLLVALKTEKEELESSLNKEKMHTLNLKQELTQAETRNTDLYKVNLLLFYSIILSSKGLLADAPILHNYID